MSLVKGALRSTEEEDRHIAIGSDIQRVATYEIVVPVKTLTSIFNKYGIKEVNLLSLDVEGYELEVLKGLDFDYIVPDYILVEARFSDDIESHLKSHYESVAEWGEFDILFRNKRLV